MKIKIGFMTLIMILMFGVRVYAADTQINVNVNGEIKKGNVVDIVFNLKDVSRLYAGSLEFTYDPSLIDVMSINGGELIKNDSVKVMEFGVETAKNKNLASYNFTCVGDIQGFNGGGKFIIIKARILNDSNFKIYRKNLKIQLVERNLDKQMQDIKFSIVGDISNEDPPKIKDEQESTTNNSNGFNSNQYNKALKGQNDKLNVSRWKKLTYIIISIVAIVTIGLSSIYMVKKDRKR